MKRRLRRQHGGVRWRKMKGVALIREDNGDVYEAEIHWFEAHGVGAFFDAINIGLVANMLLPFRAGDFAQALYLGKTTGISRSTIFSTVILERLSDFAAMCVILLGGSLFVIGGCCRGAVPPVAGASEAGDRGARASSRRFRSWIVSGRRRSSSVIRAASCSRCIWAGLRPSSDTRQSARCSRAPRRKKSPKS